MIVSSLEDINTTSLHGGPSLLREAARAIFKQSTLFAEDTGPSQHGISAIEAVQKTLPLHSYDVVHIAPDFSATLHPFGPLEVKEDDPMISIKSPSCLFRVRGVGRARVPFPVIGATELTLPAHPRGSNNMPWFGN